MSESVVEIGKLKLVEKLKNETLEEQCKRILESRIEGFILKSYWEDYECALRDEFYDEYYVFNDNLYDLEYKTIEPYCDIAEGKIQKDGTIEFTTAYYNGGACLHEMLDEVMNKINK